MKMRAYLKIKALSLAAEARLIRRQELRTLASARWIRRRHKGEIVPHEQESCYTGLREHRIGVVRSEARAAHLALAFMDGLQYTQVEGSSTRKPIPKARVEELLRKYSRQDRSSLKESLDQWWTGGQPLARAA